MLVANSNEFLTKLGLKTALSFLKTFSGDLVDGLFKANESWATPYALSIYGHETLPQGAGPSGWGYGDGRAISLGEVLTDSAERYEFQLKGAGRTPFARGGDGRAVLRSSTREFLASEAMYHLRVPTTRALALIVSHSEVVARPWYSKLSKYSQSREVEKHGGDVMQLEPVAMTTRAASSFIRIGHFELYARRLRDAVLKNQQQNAINARRDLSLLVQHTLFREFGHSAAHDICMNGVVSSDQIVALAEGAGSRLSFMASEWIRVGFVQSNFNSDNCHIAGSTLSSCICFPFICVDALFHHFCTSAPNTGKTLDYGPFGFLEQYDPSFVMWVAGGPHYAFMNQPEAAGKNFQSLIQSIIILIRNNGAENECTGSFTTRSAAILKLNALVSIFDGHSKAAVWAVLGSKLGLSPLPTPISFTHEPLDLGSAVPNLWSDLEPLMRRSAVDWTIFWRQLGYAAQKLESPLESGAIITEVASNALKIISKSFRSQHSVLPLEASEDNERDGCLLRASQDECTNNFAYMSQNCPITCQRQHNIRQRALGLSLASSSGDDDAFKDLTNAWLSWLQRWLSHKPSHDIMLLASPKYIPREWMLAEAYEKAASTLKDQRNSTASDFPEIALLQEVFSRPYEEQSEEIEKRFYRSTPSGLEQQGGIGFMS